MPRPAGYHAGAAGADVLREASLRRRVGVQTVELHHHRQGIAVFRSARRVRHWNTFPFPIANSYRHRIREDRPPSPHPGLRWLEPTAEMIDPILVPPAPPSSFG